MELPRTELIPDFKSSVYEAVAIRYLETNFWRFKYGIGGWEDAVQEAAYCFYDCRKKYGDKVHTNKHFMALYKRSLYNWFTDWANWNTKIVTSEAKYAELLRQSTHTCEPEAPLLVVLREASKELKFVLQVIFEAPAKVLSILRVDAKDNPDSFWQNAVKFSGLEVEKAPALESELRNLLK